MRRQPHRRPPQHLMTRRRETATGFRGIVPGTRTFAVCKSLRVRLGGVLFVFDNPCKRTSAFKTASCCFRLWALHFWQEGTGGCEERERTRGRKAEQAEQQSEQEEAWGESICVSCLVPSAGWQERLATGLGCCFT